MANIHVTFPDQLDVEQTIREMGKQIHKFYEHRQRLGKMQTDLERELKVIMKDANINLVQAEDNLEIVLTASGNLRGVDRERFDALLATVTDPALLTALENCYYDLAVPESVVVYNPVELRKELYANAD
jgi:hypothetical protein